MLFLDLLYPAECEDFGMDVGMLQPLPVIVYVNELPAHVVGTF
jgi:hypothetical protein